MKYTSFSDEVKKMLQDRKKTAHEAIGKYVVDEAQVRVPFDTRRLMNSIDSVAEVEQVTIGTNVEYATYVELGTRRMQAKPYLEPAVKDNWGNIENIAKEYMGD